MKGESFSECTNIIPGIPNQCKKKEKEKKG